MMNNPPPPAASATANPPPPTTASTFDVDNPPTPTAVTASAWTPRPRAPNNNNNNNNDVGGNPNRLQQNLYYFFLTYGPLIGDSCRRFLTYSMITVLFLSSLYLLIWILLGPTTPQFRLTSLSLSDLNSTSDQLLISSTFSAHFTAINPNARLHAHYGTFFISVSYDSQLLAESRLPPFRLPTRATKDVAVTLSASSAYVDDWPDVGARYGGVIRFSLRMYVVIRLDAPLLVKDKGNWFGVYCDGLLVAIPANSTGGDMIGGARFCDVRPDVNSERDFIRSKLN